MAGRTRDDEPDIPPTVRGKRPDRDPTAERPRAPVDDSFYTDPHEGMPADLYSTGSVTFPVASAPVGHDDIPPTWHGLTPPGSPLPHEAPPGRAREVTGETARIPPTQGPPVKPPPPTTGRRSSTPNLAQLQETPSRPAPRAVAPALAIFGLGLATGLLIWALSSLTPPWARAALVVETTPADAQVTLEASTSPGGGPGWSLRQGAPASFTDLPRGAPLVLTVAAEGYEPFKAVIELTEARQQRRVQLGAREVTLDVQTVPAGLEIQWEGASLGPSPATVRGAMGMSGRLVVGDPAAPAWTGPVKLGEDERLTVVMSGGMVAKATPPSPPKGPSPRPTPRQPPPPSTKPPVVMQTSAITEVKDVRPGVPRVKARVESDTGGVTFRLSDVSGSTPWRGELPIGDHTLRITNAAAGQEIRMPVTITNEEQRIRITLKGDAPNLVMNGDRFFLQ